MQNSDLALERLARLCISLENERALNDDPKWSGKKNNNYLENNNIDRHNVLWEFPTLIRFLIHV
jgi:hypothetical protein